MARRTAAQMRDDRDALLRSIPTTMWVRVPQGTPRSDVDALVREGFIQSEVRREWDRQSGNGALFGGAGVVQRHRLYVKRVERSFMARSAAIQKAQQQDEEV